MLCKNPLVYEFCFIEKNRIEKFARISASTHSSKVSIIAELFGLDDFNEFVKNFTDNFENYIDINGFYTKKLTEKQAGVAVNISNIELFQKNIYKIKKEKELIISEYYPALKILDKNIDEEFEKIDLLIHRELEKINDRLLDRHEDLINIVTNEYLNSEQARINETLHEYSELKYDLEKNEQNLRYKDLYDAIIGVEEFSIDFCPACKTKISGSLFRKVKIDPYKNAKESLERLTNIIELEKLLEEKKKEIKKLTIDFVKKYKEKIRYCIQTKFNITNNATSSYDYLLDFSVEDARNIIKDYESNKEELKRADVEILEKNEKNKKILGLRQQMEVEKERLVEFSNKIKDVKSREKYAVDILKNNKDAIESFEKNNKDLIENVSKEKKQIELNKQYVLAYKSFKDRLVRYKDNLPLDIVENLNGFIKDFYNVINASDNESHELIEEIYLPVSSDDFLKIKFQDSPTRELDALHVLSEGHLKCLGLCILLAKAVHDGNRIIIFDDAVNAIDDTHRGGIRSLLINSSNLADKQIIITCHGEEFIKDFENHVAKGDCICYSFLPPKDRKLHVKKDTFNYLAKIEKYINENKKKDALGDCRRALENLTNQLWVKLAKKHVMALKLKLNSPAHHWELMDKTAQLRMELGKLKNDGEYLKIVDILDYFLGIGKINNIVWNYLNKGTHDGTDGEEFDMDIIKEMHEKLVEFFKELNSK